MKKEIKEPVTVNIIYDRIKAREAKQPQFKPGNTPYCKLGNETLNAHINWLDTLQEILDSKQFTLTNLSGHLSIKKEVLDKILENDLSQLNFKTGAKLLRVHEAIRFDMPLQCA